MQHGRVVHRHSGVKVATLHIATRGAAGHEGACTGVGRHTAQRQIFECIDGHSRNVLPALEHARGFATTLAKLLERAVVFKLVSEQFQCERIEIVVAHRWSCDECQQF